MVSELQGRFYEQTYRQNTFHLTLSAVATVGTGNLVGAASGTTFNICLWNPTGNTKNLVIQRVYIKFQGGTPAAGTLYHGWGTGITATASVLTNGALTNGFLAGATSTARGQAVTTAAAIAGSSAVNTLRPLTGPGFLATAMASALGVPGNDEETAGDIIIPPGYFWAPLLQGTGTSPTYVAGVTWTEVPV